MKRIVSLLLVSVFLLAALAGCGGGGNKGTGDGGAVKSVIIGGKSDLVTLDPGRMYETHANMFSYAAYDMLYRVKSGTMGTPEPSVATEYTVDESGKVYTFKMREDVKFASGNPMTANDVVWSVNRVRNMKDSQAYSMVKIVEKVEAPDDYTVVFTLTEADASFLVKLTSNAYCILDSKVVKEHGGSDQATDSATEWLNNQSAGSGPYVIKSWKPKEQLVLEKNPNYWGEASNIDTIYFREMESADAQITALQNGDIDIALGLSAENAKQLENKDGITVATGATATMTFLVMSRDSNLSKELSNPKVQEAVRYAIDYESLLSLAGDGATVPLNFVQSGFVGGLTRDLATEGRDLEKAKALMTEAGYPNGFSVTLTCGTNSSEGLAWTTMAQLIEQNLAEIGIKVKIETQETTLVYDKMRQGTMPFYLMFWSPDYYDINNQLAFLPGTGENGTAYGQRAMWELTPDNQAIVDLGNKVFTETDEAQRTEYSKQMQLEFAKDNPFAFLLQHAKIFAYNNSRLETVTFSDLCKIEICELKLK